MVVGKGGKVENGGGDVIRWWIMKEMGGVAQPR